MFLGISGSRFQGFEIYVQRPPETGVFSDRSDESDIKDMQAHYSRLWEQAEAILQGLAKVGR